MLYILLKLNEKLLLHRPLDACSKRFVSHRFDPGELLSSQSLRAQCQGSAFRLNLFRGPVLLRSLL